jgi:hypothetical protein
MKKMAKEMIDRLEKKSSIYKQPPTGLLAAVGVLYNPDCGCKPRQRLNKE